MSKKVKVNKNTKVAIVGFAPSWNLAPYDNVEFDIWGLNELYIQAKGKRFTHWFEIHDPKSPSKSGGKHQTWLKECKLPLYMQQHYKEFPSSIAYPRDEVKAMVTENFILEGCGSAYTDYSNQVTWMILLAIYQGYKEIHVYGVDMAQQSEYAWQRSSCQFAIGLAIGKGIKVLVPSNSELCKYPRDYGFETDNSNRHLKKERIKSLQQSIFGFKTQILDLEFQYKDKHEKFKELKLKISDELTRIGDELVKLNVHVVKNREIINFLNTMPQDLSEINEKRLGLVQQVGEQNLTMEKAMVELEKKAKELQAQLDRESKTDFMNLKTLEETKINMEKQMHTAGGAMGECNYDLSNNRV